MRILNPQNFLQRGVHARFIGFPSNKPGWLLYSPRSGKFISTVDATFDEGITSSGIAYNELLFHDALPTRANGPSNVDINDITHYTGPPFSYETETFSHDEDEPLPKESFEEDAMLIDIYEDGKPKAVVAGNNTQSNPSDKEYAVENIENIRTTPEGNKEYLIKWKNHTQRTWEPRSNLNEQALKEADELERKFEFHAYCDDEFKQTFF